MPLLDHVKRRFREFSHDEKHLTALVIKGISDQSGVKEELVAQLLIFAITLLLLPIWSYSGLLAHSLLFGYPLTLSVFRKAESLSSEQRDTYWPLLAFVTLCNLSFGLSQHVLFYLAEVSLLLASLEFPGGWEMLAKNWREITGNRKNNCSRKSQLITEKSSSLHSPVLEGDWIVESSEVTSETLCSPFEEATITGSISQRSAQCTGVHYSPGEERIIEKKIAKRRTTAPTREKHGPNGSFFGRKLRINMN